MNTAKINAFESHAPILGARLFKLALAWSRDIPETIKDGMEQIGSIKGRKKIKGGLRATYDAVMEAAETIKKARRLHRISGTVASPRKGRMAILLPKGTLEQRLARVTRKWFLNAMINNIDLSVAGDETYTVELTREPTKVTAGEIGRAHV